MIRCRRVGFVLLLIACWMIHGLQGNESSWKQIGIRGNRGNGMEDVLHIIEDLTLHIVDETYC